MQAMVFVGALGLGKHQALIRLQNGLNLQQGEMRPVLSEVHNCWLLNCLLK